VSFKIILTTSVTRLCFTTQHQTCKDQNQDNSVQDQDQDRFVWSQTGLVLRPTVSDHITGFFCVIPLTNNQTQSPLAQVITPPPVSSCVRSSWVSISSRCHPSVQGFRQL